MRPITVQVGPSLTNTANNIATSQTPGGVSGTTNVTFTAASASITATNSFISGQAVQFGKIGSSASKDAGRLPGGFVTGLTYYVIATGLSGAAFQVSQTPGGGAVVAGSNTLTGTQYVIYSKTMALNGTLAANGVATLATPQRVLITTADTTTTFTIYGTSVSGTPQSESFLIVAGASYSALDYATVTSITVSGLPTAAVTVGTNAIGSTPWVRLDEWAHGECSVQCNATGTVNYTVQVSNDDPNSPTNSVLPSAMTWIATNDTLAVGATTSIQTNFFFSPTFARVLLNSGSGSVKATFIQYDVVSR